MTISVNGQAREFADGTSLGVLLAELGVNREGIAVARNDDVVPRSALDATPLRDGDSVEIIVAVAGG